MALYDDYSLTEVKGLAQCQGFAMSGLGTIDTLPDIPCKYAVISQWTVGSDPARTAKTGASAATEGSGSAGVEVYWGFNGVLAFQLFTGQRTELLPINNLNQISVSGNGVLYYAWFS